MQICFLLNARNSAKANIRQSNDAWLQLIVSTMQKVRQLLSDHVIYVSRRCYDTLQNLPVARYTLFNPKIVNAIFSNPPQTYNFKLSNYIAENTNRRSDS